METQWVLLCGAVRAEHDADAPDFTLPLAMLPGVTFLAAGRSAHPDPNRSDRHPFIIAAAPGFLLAGFAVAPFDGLYFAENPTTPDSSWCATSDLVSRARSRPPPSTSPTASASSPTSSRTSMIYMRCILTIQSVGLVPDIGGGYTIAKLQVHKGGDRATLVTFDSVHRVWFEEDVGSPLPAHERGRERNWVPHSVVVLENTLWWFDLSWGSFSCDINVADPDLRFHRLPLGRALPEANQFVFSKRCVTVSQGTLRYVKIIDGAGIEVAAVHLWTLVFDEIDWEWAWQENYAVRFNEIWNGRSYTDTGLPQSIPLLAAVSPSDPNMVYFYFTLMQRIVGVNVQERRIVHFSACNVVVNNAALVTEAAGLYVLPWHLPPAVANSGVNVGGWADIMITKGLGSCNHPLQL
ncbi:unnamed protein product [Urochloa decumbens]|uniref:DUF1618 domain-containing protein n=1 Tax=Urochloa decumbens TaxID=240449 RepID=A0ABC9DGI4_9POAL